LRLRFTDKPVRDASGAWSFEHFNVVNTIAVNTVGGWHIHYVFQGNECVSVEVTLDEDTEYTVGTTTYKIRDMLKRKGMTLKDVADILTKAGVSGITIE